ncbi:tRNA (guanine(46)-N(7))-methyltransferase TrmB [Botrimarina hoheduenensis]|uniref:tRNA (guanine-N(7)-)-methyltransferase n=1 Tax=Botrimarina hoheduenensis TaxID=2528000 RepID=A0A5C5VZ25_9BACT|nr:tRNA (guanosine(46)-N7)-methyltransferase TrmB [Botrimarina hoheduenensis]TWT43295.1 tRNA (guanine-N(7)-)-methyltransferase [Botrimarina hoheduenensis]
MGRRAIPSIHRQLDLSGVLVTIDDLPRPWDNGARLFGPARAGLPLEVEIGSGKGMFLRRATGERPNHNFLGVEIAHKYARYCAALLTREQRENGVVLSGDGARLMSEVLPTGGLEAVHVYFPDPWWKKRHHKRRLMNNADFLTDVARTLRPGGALHFWTDVPEYFEAAVEFLAAMRAERGLPLEGPHPVPEPPSLHELDFHTHFERRTRLNDQPVFRSRFVRS